MTDAAHVEAPSVLIVVPARATGEAELDPLLQTLVALRSTAPDAMTLVIDRSPGPQAAMIEIAAAELGCAYAAHDPAANEASALNVGLVNAPKHGMDACLFAPGLLPDAGWLRRLRARTGSEGQLAAVAGGAVVNPDGTVRHAGYFFSLFRRAWGARLGRTPEVMLDVTGPLLCPVGWEIQLIRSEWIERVGLYDEELDGANAALDYCLRVTAAGGECVFEPTVRGRALAGGEGEPDDRGESAHRLQVKHAGVSFRQWVPEVL
jgi:GT2 family glycosyltransferase